MYIIMLLLFRLMGLYSMPAAESAVKKELQGLV